MRIKLTAVPLPDSFRPFCLNIYEAEDLKDVPKGISFVESDEVNERTQIPYAEWKVETTKVKYKIVKSEWNYDREGWDQDEIKIEIEEGEPYFDQPRFNQGDCFPITCGNQAYLYLDTINDAYGDGGNYNIFVLCDEDGIPFEAVFQTASC